MNVIEWLESFVFEWINTHPVAVLVPAEKLPQSTAGLYIFYQYRTNERDRRYLPNTQYPHWSNPCTEPLAQAFREHTLFWEHLALQQLDKKLREV